MMSKYVKTPRKRGQNSGHKFIRTFLWSDMPGPNDGGGEQSLPPCFFNCNDTLNFARTGCNPGGGVL